MTRGRSAMVWSVFVLLAVGSAVSVGSRPAYQRLSDLHIYRGAVQHLQAGHPLYGFVAENGGPFTYPPFAALLLWPIGLVPEIVVQVVWSVLVVAAVATLGWLIAGHLRLGAYPSRVVAPVVACAVLLSAPAQSNLRFGQISIFIVLAALVDAMGATPARYRGVLIGVAAAVKLTPLLFVVFLLGTGRYRDAGRAVAAFAGCAAVGAVLLPSDSVTFWTRAVADTSRIGNLASLGNQSVHGMLLRVGVTPPTLPLLWAALVGVLCAIALLRARQLHRASQPAHAAVLVGCATVVASPVSWTHHQIWPVLAAMLLVGATTALRRAAGAVLLTVMVVSLGVVLAPAAPTQGMQFVFENARALAAVTLCVVGFGSVVVVATAHRPVVRPRRWARVAVTAAAVVAFVAVQPLPAGADPTFKAYGPADVADPRYFFVCRDATGCAVFLGDRPIRIGTAAERTKARVNGVADATVARLEYRSAPGGAARRVPLLPMPGGLQVFSFRSANLAHGSLVAYDTAGYPVASYSAELQSR